MKPKRHSTKVIRKKASSQQLIAVRRELSTVLEKHEALRKSHALHLRSCRGDEHCRRLSEAHANQLDKLSDQAQYITYLEDQVQTLQARYEHKISGVKKTASILEKELLKVRSDLENLVTRAESADILRQQVKDLHSKIMRRDSVIEKYESKYGNIFSLIKELHQKCRRADVAVDGGAAAADEEEASLKSFNSTTTVSTQTCDVDYAANDERTTKLNSPLLVQGLLAISKRRKMSMQK